MSGRADFASYSTAVAVTRSTLLKQLLFLKGKGIKFYDVDVGPFQEAVESVYEKNAERVGGRAAIEQVANQ